MSYKTRQDLQFLVDGLKMDLCRERQTNTNLIARLRQEEEYTSKTQRNLNSETTMNRILLDEIKELKLASKSAAKANSGYADINIEVCRENYRLSEEVKELKLAQLSVHSYSKCPCKDETKYTCSHTDVFVGLTKFGRVCLECNHNALHGIEVENNEEFLRRAESYSLGESR
tara:strand:- start:136 stop:651 length:516 start_codon:yes stop_codon:yes gene_type:complete